MILAMSTLEADVSQGLTAQGLEVDEERGGLLVRAEPGGSPTSVWINEAERIVRAERVIAYPVDDYSESLGQALDWLNANRAGVSYSFQEAQRAVVGRTAWSSPNRTPAPGQLHLLIALLDRAKGRDGPALSRIAEGEGSWDDVAEGEDVREAGADGAVGERSDPLTLRFTTSRFDPEELMREPATQPAAASGWVEPPTRAIQELSTRNTLDAETQNLRPEDLVAQEPTGGGYSKEDLARRLESGPKPPATSRLAFQLAVQQLDEDEGHEKQDMTVARRSLARRALRVVVLLAVMIPLLLILFDRIVAPFIPREHRVWERWGEKVLAPDPTALELRRQVPVGAELLALELSEPLEGRDVRIEGSLRVLGADARAALEDYMIVSESSDARKRAYALWIGQIEAGVEPHLALLKRLNSTRPGARPDITRYLRESIQRSPPADALLIESLEWARSGPHWAFLIDLLGRPGEGAEVRAAALTKELPHDGPECIVLRALIRTGHGSPDSVSILLQKRGAEWCGSREGRELLVSLIRKEPDATDVLLEHHDRVLALLGVNLLREGGTEDTVRKLVKVAYSRKTPAWVRERTVEALSGRDAEVIRQATWPLVYVLNDAEAAPSLLAEVRRTLKTYGSPGVEALETYTVRDRSSTRRYALIGLGAMESSAATERIVARLGEEPDARLRLLAVNTLSVLSQEQSQRSLLRAEALVLLRKLSLEDSDPQVRAAAEGLYRTLTKH